jgi:hypothetical protein
MEQYPDFHRDHFYSLLYGICVFPRALKPTRDVAEQEHTCDLPACGSSGGTMAADNPEAGVGPALSNFDVLIFDS